MKPNLSKMIRSVQMTMAKHSPEILTGIGIAGMVTTTIMAVKATPKAMKLLEEEQQRHDEPLTKTETVKAAWKPYIPAAVTGAISVACLVGGGMKRGMSASGRNSLSARSKWEICEKPWRCGTMSKPSDGVSSNSCRDE